MSDKPQTDLVAEARENATYVEGVAAGVQDARLGRAALSLRALCNEVEHARRALKGMVELWDANHPGDPCGCVGASDDCKYPPTCECCVARMVAEGRTKELFE